MRIFITGGCGFIGSNFIHFLSAKKNIKILNMDKLTYAANPSNLDSINNLEDYDFIKGDICNYKLVSEAMVNFRPDVVVNFAAESHVDKSINNPDDFINTNILGTYNLLSASKDYISNFTVENFKFIHISTDEVFGSLGNNGYFDESSAYKPSSPYSASKASSDHLAKSWFNTYNFPVIVTNCSNNYGPYQFPEKLIPLLIANCIDEKHLPIYGNGLNIRDWIHVLDHCEAIFTIMNHSPTGESYNIGGNEERSNIEITKTICKILDEKRPRSNGNSHEDLIIFVEDRPGHDFRYAIDSTKIKNELGWKPSKSFDIGIYETIQWYIDNESWWRRIAKNT